jgi:tetraprenyl-beta-curcumene synthase
VTLALARALLLYWLVIFPRARRELRQWTLRATAIADPVIREHALGKLSSERLVAEGAAAFAILAKRRHRTDVIRACVAYEVIYDLVDALGEEHVDDVLAHNLALHSALLDALTPAAPSHAHLAHYGGHDDGGYLFALIAACRDALAKLPAHATVLPALRRFASRARNAQSLNHAGAHDAHRGLARWAASQPVEDARWWEVAAAASDPLGVFALIAAASDRRCGSADVAAIERGYFPWIGALVWMLESLVDSREDAVTGNHSYVARYESAREAAARLALVAARASRAARELPLGRRHAVLLSGVVGLYLSSPGASEHAALEAASAVRRAVGGPVIPLLAVLRGRRVVGRMLSIRLRRASTTHA